jgi:trimethyllysine dioxygenase
MQDMKPGMQDLHDYGILRIAAMPSSMEDTERLARKIGFIMETIYGKMWTTNPQTDDQQYSDTASSNIELLHHTDGTYILDPPGLQIFNCIAQAGEGGDSCYIDSFYVVEKLRQTCPEAFDFFAKKTFHFHHYGKDVHYATMEPIIKLDHLGNIKHFRHNDYDRAPLTHMSYEDVEKFYTYHDKLLNIMRNGKMEFVSKMKVGEMVVVDNHRVMHARRAFLGNERALIGCYIGRNEYENRLRMLGII